MEGGGGGGVKYCLMGDCKKIKPNRTARNDLQVSYLKNSQANRVPKRQKVEIV